MSSLKEELISFDTAKLAKEKGFNIPYPAYFHIENNIPVEYNFVYTNIMASQFSDIREGGNIKSRFYYSRPTQSLLQKWLREVYDIEIMINRIPPEAISIHNPTLNNYSMVVWNEKGNPRIINNTTFHKTYEEALEEGLQQALKLIQK